MKFLGAKVLGSHIDQEKHYMWNEAIYNELFQIHKVLVELKDDLTSKEEK